MKWSVFVTVSCLLFCNIAIAQKDAGIKKLLNKEAEFILPQTHQTITTTVKVKPSIKKDEVQGTVYEWSTPSGLIITSYTVNDKVVDVFFTVKNDNAVISGLPYQLIFNKTEVTDCEKKFASFELYTKGYVDIGNGTTEYKLVYKKDDRFIYFFFNQKGLLKGISLTDFDLDAAN